MSGLGESILEQGIEQGLHTIKDAVRRLLNGKLADSLLDKGFSENIIASAKEILGYVNMKP